MSATGDLLDVNVWLALAVEDHKQHDAAVEGWNRFTRPSFCRITQLGFLRLLCNPHVMGKAVFGPETAWSAYEQLAKRGAVEFIAEPEGLEARLEQLIRGAKVSRDLWTDSYLAAFAKCAGLRLVTFDTGFSRYKDINCLLLGAGQ